MVATVLVEPFHTGEFLITEANGTLSREEITVTALTAALPPGQLMGKITTVITAPTSAAVAGMVGNGTMGTVAAAQGVTPGVYRVIMIEPATDLGKFVVEGPNGVVLGVGTVGTAFVAGGLTFTIADGATDFAAGDSFTITVGAGSLKWNKYATAGVNGTQNVAGILWRGLPINTGDQEAVVIVRHAEVARQALTGLDAAGEAALKALDILVRG